MTSAAPDVNTTYDAVQRFLLIGQEPPPEKACRRRERAPREKEHDLPAHGGAALQEESRERSGQHRRDGRQRRDEPLGVPPLRVLPEMPLEDREVHGALDVARRRQVVTRAEEDPRVEREEDADGDGHSDSPAPPHREQDPRAEDVREANAREDARDAQVRQALEKRHEGVERHEPADEDDRHPSPERVPREIAAIRALRHALLEREDARDADDEEEPREDEVRRRPAVPLRVVERPVEVPPVPRVVHEDHPDDRQAAEHVEGGEARAGGARLAAREEKEEEEEISAGS